MVAYESEERPELILEEELSEETFGRIVAEPLEAGFGVTIGNALRRTLLSALDGTAITAVRIEGVEHEFTTVPNLKEDVVEFLLNVKDIRIRSLTDRPGKMYLEASGDGVVTAGQIEQTADYEIVNPELKLGTLEGAKAKLSVELTVQQGSGYVPAGTSEGLPIGVIPVDAIFSPVRRVNYRIDHGQRRRQQGRRDPRRAVRHLLTVGAAGTDRCGPRAWLRLRTGAGPLQHADRRPQPLGAGLQLPQAQRPDDRGRRAGEERGRVAGAA
jgi:hypothetical protein